MIKSKADFLSIFLLLIATLSAIGLLIWSTIDWLTLNKTFGLIPRILLTAVSVLGTGIFIWFEFPKLKSIEINDKAIILRNILTRNRQDISINEIDGFMTTSKWAKGGPVYEIILVLDGQPFQKLSSNYIKNYDQIREGIKRRLTPLKVDDFENIRSIVKGKIRE